MITLTKAQRIALYKVWQRPVEDKKSYKEFRKSVQGGWDYVMVQWCGMWLGIEKDGYTHS
jgi:hypothetical protein